MIFSNVSNDINDDGAEDANGGEDCQSGFTAFLGRHIGLPVGQGFGFGGDAAGGDGRDVRAHLVFERGILARAVEGLLVFVVVVVHGSAPFLIVGLFAFLIVGLLDFLLDCLHVRLPACNQV